MGAAHGGRVAAVAGHRAARRRLGRPRRRAGSWSSGDLAAAALGSVPVAWLLGRPHPPPPRRRGPRRRHCTVFFRAAYPALVRRVVAPGDLASGVRPAVRHRVGDAGRRARGRRCLVAGRLRRLRRRRRRAELPRLGGLPAPAGPAPEAALLAAAPDASRCAREVATGIRVRPHDRFLRFFTLRAGRRNFGLTGYAALLVLFLVRDLDLDPRGVGLVMAAGSVGGLVGASVATRASRWLGDARALVALQVVSGPPALLIALAQPGVRVVLVPPGSPGRAGGGGRQRDPRHLPDALRPRRSCSPAPRRHRPLVNFGTMPLAGLAAGWLGCTSGCARRSP